MATTDRDYQVLTDQEGADLLEWALTCNPGGMVEEDLLRIFDWACEARIDSTLLGLVLERRVQVSVKEGEVLFNRIEGDE
jgi:hypothetical protein